MKKILIVSFCSVRSSGKGLTSDFLRTIDLGNDIKIDLFDSSILKKHNRDDYLCDSYYQVPVSPLTKVLSKYRVTRFIWNECVICNEFTRILNKNEYDLVILFQLPRFSDRLVKIAQKHSVKTALHPWGSDILRCNKVDATRISRAVKQCDYILGYNGSVALRTVLSKYHVPPVKIVSFSMVAPGVERIQNIRDRYTRGEMQEFLGIPYSDFNIVCGYNADPGQQHVSSIESLFQVKEFLPKGYQVIFPVTYGDRGGYVESLKRMCADRELNGVFIEEFITDEQMALLHLVTDLYINNQKTDNGNAFLIEALSCNNSIISGSWLNYTQFEEYGVPYYQFETQEKLADALIQVLTERKRSVEVPVALIQKLQSTTNDTLKIEWRDFFNQL